MTTELDRACAHEAGHAVAAFELGRTLGPVGVAESGRGCTVLWSQPAIDADKPDVGLPLSAWPVPWQRWAHSEALVFLAGDIAEGLFSARPTGRVPDTVASLAGQLVTASTEDRPPTATAAERELMSGLLAAPAAVTDADALALVAWIAHGGDPLRSGTWLAWVAEEARALLLVREARVRRLAALLTAERTVGAEAAARAMTC